MLLIFTLWWLDFLSVSLFLLPMIYYFIVFFTDISAFKLYLFSVWPSSGFTFVFYRGKYRISPYAWPTFHMFAYLFMTIVRFHFPNRTLQASYFNGNQESGRKPCRKFMLRALRSIFPINGDHEASYNSWSRKHISHYWCL